MKTIAVCLSALIAASPLFAQERLPIIDMHLHALAANAQGPPPLGMCTPIDPMPALPKSNPAQFVQGAPVLHVPDVEKTAKYYRDVLGFTWDFGDQSYAVVWRDNSAIHFVKDDRVPVGVHLFQWVRDVDAYHREIVGRGAVVASEPTDQPYGIREFDVRDINGVGIVFGQDIEHD